MEPVNTAEPRAPHSGEWEELRGRVRHRVTEALDLITILLQDAVILLVGFLAEFAYERWLHSSQPFFQFALSLSSALFLLLYVVTVTVHVVHYVRGQFGTESAGVLSQYLPWALAAGGVIAAAVAVTVPDLRSVASPRVTRTMIAQLSTAQLSVNSGGRDVAISPDGARVAYVGNEGTQLFVRALDQLEPTPIATLSGGYTDVFFSPDGQSVAFSDSTRTLKKVAITGGPVLTICRLAADLRGGTWGIDDTIIFADANTAAPGLLRVSAAGGEPAVLTQIDRARGEGRHVYPAFLPDSGSVLFTITSSTGTDAAQVAVLDLRTGMTKRLLRSGSGARYIPAGYLLYGTAGSGALRAVPFNLNRLEVTGAAVTAVSQVLTKEGGRYSLPDFDVALDGTLVYVSGGVQSGAPRSLVWVDRQGREEAVNAPVRGYLYPRISPDGTRVLLDIRDQENDIWIWDVSRETLTRTTFEPGLDRYPVWTSDGTHIVFTSDRAGGTHLFEQAADGTGSADRLTQGPNTAYATSVSPDGTQLVFDENVSPTTRNLMVLTLDKAHLARPLITSRFNEMNGEISPDGRWLAYQSDDSGHFEIFVRPFPDVRQGHWQVSTDGGTRPLWARDGQELFYVAAAGAVMSVRVNRGSTWTAAAPMKLFDGGYFLLSGTNPGRTYDVSPDGRRFLVIKASPSAQTAAVRQLVLVQNWLDEVKRRVLVPGSH